MQDDRRAVGGLVAFIAIMLGCLLIGAVSPVRPASAAGPPSAQVSGGEGLSLYLESCAACHGPGGVGSADGPSLIGVGAAAADFMLRTGRMPLPAPDAPMVRRDPLFSDVQIRALVDYVACLGDGPPIPACRSREPTCQGSRTVHHSCAACHGPGAGGDAVGGGYVAPPLLDEPVIVGEAIRTGPGAMPAFGPGQISDDELVRSPPISSPREDAAPGGLTWGAQGRSWRVTSRGSSGWASGAGGTPDRAREAGDAARTMDGAPRCFGFRGDDGHGVALLAVYGLVVRRRSRASFSPSASAALASASSCGPRN